jgi:hypothetical protein
VFSSPWLHSRAINILRNVLSYHDFDQRLGINDEKNNRNRVARLYLPLLHIISSNINKLFDPGNASFGKNNKKMVRFIHLCLFIGQLNRPSVTTTPTEDLLTSNGDEFITENDGTLVKTKTFLFRLII